MPLLSLSKSPSPSRTEFEPEAAPGMASTSISHPRRCEIGSDRQRLSPGVLGGHHYFRSRETWQHRAECLVEPPPKIGLIWDNALAGETFPRFPQKGHDESCQQIPSA